MEETLFITNKQLKKINARERQAMLAAVRENLESSDFTENNLEQPPWFSRTARYKTWHSLRAGACCDNWHNVAPGLFETLHVLGKDITLRRLAQ